MNATAVPRVRPFLSSETQTFLVLSVLIGLTAGLIIVCFHESIELLSWWSEDVATQPGVRVLLPGLGAAAAALLVRHAAPEARGSGIVQTKSALYVSNGYIPPLAVPGKFLACSLSIGTGAPLGPEDPSLLMGAGVASMFGRAFHLPRRSLRLIAPIGAAAGIAAAFNTPITGVLFVVEEVVAAWDAAVLGSIVLAAVSAVVTTRFFLGDAPLFRVPEFTAMGDPREAAVFALLGIAAGLVAAVYVRAVATLRSRLRRDSRLPAALAPLVAGSVVGAVGVWLPEVLGTGYRAMDAALHSQYTWTALALFGVAKLALAALAFGTGTPGGLFAPTLFVGVMLGGAAGGLAPAWLPFAASPVSAYVLAGMGGVFAGVFRAPMTAVFMAFELSATHVIIVPAMITATLGYLVTRQLQPKSLLDLVAEDEGAVLPSAQAQREEEPLRVEHAAQSRTPILDAGVSCGVARAALAESGADVALIRLDGRGWASLDLEALASISANATPDEPIGRHATLELLPVTHPDEPLDAALRRLGEHPILPVVSRLDPGLLVGAITLADVHRAYGLEKAQGSGLKAQGGSG